MKRPIRIEIFRAGRHTAMNGESVEFTEADLAQIAKVYSPALHEAPVVLGHPKDNDPAYGWAKGVFAKGPSLQAALGQVELGFSEAVRDGRYKKVSASFYKKDSASNPTPGQYYLRHIGFLGAQPPAVKGLQPVEFADGDDCLTIELGESRGSVSFAEEAAEEVAEQTTTPVADAVTKAVTTELQTGVADAVRTSLTEALSTDLGDRLVAALGEGADAEAVKKAVTEALAAALADGDTPFATAIGAAFTDKLGEPLKAAVDAAVKSTLQPALETAIATAVPAAGTLDNSEHKGRKTKAELELEAREKALREKEQAIRTQTHTSFVEGVLKEGRRLPAPKAQIISLLNHLEVSGSDVSFGEGEQAVSPLELVKAIVTKLPKEVELRELTARGLDVNFSEDTDPAVVARAAEAYQAEQRKLGNIISTTDAVNHVKGI
ncbi:MAG TPA: hypothetical protein VN764_17320 [Polyangiaceae bacterium]|nr:hypothetical protein [Polyangiaceae bacterium]